MLSLVGAILIIGSTAALGLSSVWRMGMRVRVLTDLVAALATMKSEICDRLTPIPALIEQLARESDPPLDGLFHRVSEEMGSIGIRSFYLIWKSAVERAQELALTDAERQTLIDLGRSLGRYGTEEQRDALTYTLRRLEGHLRRAEEERREQGRLHAALGLAAGVFVVMILL